MLDYEAFCARLKVARGWDEPRCKVQWAELKMNPDIIAGNDMGRPSWRPKRLPVPSWLVAADYNRHESVAFQEKKLERTNKSKAQC